MSKSPPFTTMEVLEKGLNALKSSLPKGWEVSVRREPKMAAGRRADAIVNVSSPNRILMQLLVEAYDDLPPREIPALSSRDRTIRELAGGSAVIAVAPWLSERSRDLLTEAAINYLDLTGNVRLELTNPGLFIERVPQQRPSQIRQSRVFLRGPKAGRLVRVLADVAPPYAVQALAKASGATSGYVSKVLEYLERQDLVARTPRGGVASVDWSQLVRLRATTYDVFKTNPATLYIAPAGPVPVLERLRDESPRTRVTLTGSFATIDFVKVAAPSLLAIYLADDTTATQADLAQELSLLPADQGANVAILKPYDESVLERRRWRDPPDWLPRTVPAVACAQLALDCLTGTGRMPSEGEALLSWMADNEDVWRYPSLGAAPPWGDES